jgi:diaminopimelate epimerase
MTTLALTKHHGLRNDFLVVFEPDVADRAALAVALCDRRTGIGADGLLIGDAADGYAARMTLYNADGSRAEMSGNGIRCFAQAVSERIGTLDPQMILTDAGDRLVTLFGTDDARVIDARVDMGRVAPLPEPQGWAALQCNPDRPVAHLSVGNPHSVFGVDDVTVADLSDLGAKVPHINLEIVEPGPESNAITMRVHERGAGITAACGTGACASAYAARKWGLVPASESDVVVHMDGGTAVVSFEPNAPDHAMLTGPSALIARIEVEVS